MNFKIILPFAISLIFLYFPLGKISALSLKNNTEKPPPRIIRTCCSFGYELKMFGVPFKTFTEVTSVSEIGKHVFLGAESENNGIIYTERGGFIDLGHVRDVADWTNYLYNKIIENKGFTKEIFLGYEGGKKTLSLSVPLNISDADAIVLAGRIAYEISIWHEIGTWFGTSYIPLIPERYSAFSPEDLYSNLTGATIGIKAIQSENSYEEAVTDLISELLIDLQAVKTRKETLEAMETINGKWWTREKILPSKNVLMKRYVDASFSLEPWSISEDYNNLTRVFLPEFKDESIINTYKLAFDLNFKIPVKKIFPERNSKIITQEDFTEIIDYIKTDVDLLEGKKL